MMLFKHFLQQQDDNITDEEASLKYKEYKMEFRRTQLNEFFLAHKEEEWLVLLCVCVCVLRPCFLSDNQLFTK